MIGKKQFMKHLICILVPLALAICVTAQTDKSTPLLAIVPTAETTPAAIDEAGWRQLFDGKTLDGWEVKSGFATYRVEDGTIVGRTAEGSGNTFLCTKEQFADFELDFEVLLESNELNSGVQVRSQIRAGDYGGRVYGPQVEIATSPGLSGFLYGEGLKGWLSSELKSDDKKSSRHDLFKNRVWNQFKVRAVGPRIQTWINGHTIADLTLVGEQLETFSKGLIGLQVHGIGKKSGDPFQVRFRNIRIRPLSF
jgi:hypothetical protein